LAGDIPDSTQGVLDLQQTLIDLAKITTGPFKNDFIRGWLDSQQAQHDAAQQIIDDAERVQTETLQTSAQTRDHLGRTYRTMGDSAVEMSNRTRTAMRRARDAIVDLKDRAKEAADELIDKVFDPIIARDELLANKAEIAAARRVLASKTATAAEKRDARATIHQLTKDNLELQVELLRAGKLSKKEQEALIAELKRRAKTATGTTKKYIDDLITEILRLGALDTSINISTSVTRDVKRHQQGKIPHAKGGPVYPGETYLVGEEGPETLVMGNQSGTIIPNGAGGGGTQVIQLVVDGKVLAEVVDAHQYRALQRSAPTALRA
jgi:hypothetical protein